MMDDLSRTLIPMLNSLWPAIQGLLQLPTQLPDQGDDPAYDLSRWNEVTAMLREPGATEAMPAVAPEVQPNLAETDDWRPAWDRTAKDRA